MSDPEAPPAPARISERPLTWRDVTAPLVWTLILRAPAMAMAPPRLFLGFLGVFALSVWGAIFGAIDPSPAEPALRPIGAALSRTIDAAAGLEAGLLITRFAALAELLVAHLVATPWASALAAAPALLILGIAGHAIARSAGLEYATGRHTDATDALIHACRSVRQIALATLGPPLLTALLGLAVVALGLPLGIPVLDLIGAALYALALVLGAAAMLVLALHAVSLPMTVAALAIEDTDGFDAIQRAFAYTVARPLRLALYTALALVTGTLIVGIIAALLSWSLTLTDALAGSLTNDAGRRVLTGGDQLGATAPAAHAIVDFWRALVNLVVSGYVLSLGACAATMIYLAMRRVCDGQDTTEIWDPAD